MYIGMTAANKATNL